MVPFAGYGMPVQYPSGIIKEHTHTRTAAGLFWGTGELFTVVVAAVVVRQWWLAEQRAAAREERAIAAR